MFDRHDQVQDLDHVWTDPPGSQALYGPRRFEGWCLVLLCVLGVGGEEEVQTLGLGPVRPRFQTLARTPC